MVGYDDGCITRACITGQKSYGLPGGNDFIAKAVIARQTAGKRMFAAYDPPAGPVAEPPLRPLPPGAGISCDGNVAVDPTGDANRKKSFREEFRGFLKKYEIDYDERYVWD